MNFRPILRPARRRGALRGFSRIAAAFLAAATSVGAAFEARPFARVRPLDAAETRAHPVAAFALDDDLFEHTRADFGDVRVTDDAGAEVPCLPRRRVTIETRWTEHPVELTVVALNPSPGPRLEIVLEKPAAETGEIHALNLVTGLRDFEKTVSVEASNDRTAWTVVADNALVYDYARYVSLRQTRIEVNPGPFRYYRLNIAGATDARQSPLRTLLRERRGGELFSEQEHVTLTGVDFRIDRVTGIVRRETAPREQGVDESRRLTAFDVATDGKTGDTLIAFELPRIPLNRIVLETDSANFVRPVFLEGADGVDDPQWTPVGSATLVSVAIGDLRRRELEIAVRPARRFARYRLRIRNGDSPPIVLTALAATAEAWDIQFFHEPERSYRVYYGSRTAPRPEYDIGNVLGRAKLPGADAYRLGVPRDNPEHARPARGPVWSGRALLIAATLAAAAVLLWLIARASRVVEKTGND